MRGASAAFASDTIYPRTVEDATNTRLVVTLQRAMGVCIFCHLSSPSFECYNTPMLDKILQRVIITPGCWVWDGYRDNHGYAILTIRKSGQKHYRVHRKVYEYYFGIDDESLVVDHLCGNTWCINPYHLDAVTQAVNVQRGRRAGKGSGKYVYPNPKSHRPYSFRACPVCGEEKLWAVYSKACSQSCSQKRKR